MGHSRLRRGVRRIGSGRGRLGFRRLLHTAFHHLVLGGCRRHRGRGACHSGLEATIRVGTAPEPSTRIRVMPGFGAFQQLPDIRPAVGVMGIPWPSLSLFGHPHSGLGCLALRGARRFHGPSGPLCGIGMVHEPRARAFHRGSRGRGRRRRSHPLAAVPLRGRLLRPGPGRAHRIPETHRGATAPARVALRQSVEQQADRHLRHGSQRTPGGGQRHLPGHDRSHARGDGSRRDRHD